MTKAVQEILQKGPKKPHVDGFERRTVNAIINTENYGGRTIRQYVESAVADKRSAWFEAMDALSDNCFDPLVELKLKARLRLFDRDSIKDQLADKTRNLERGLTRYFEQFCAKTLPDAGARESAAKAIAATFVRAIEPAIKTAQPVNSL